MIEFNMGPIPNKLYMAYKTELDNAILTRGFRVVCLETDVGDIDVIWSEFNQQWYPEREIDASMIQDWFQKHHV